VISIRTDYPIAADSLDHLHPCGTARDNSRHREWNRRLYQLIPAGSVRLLDLGCAGGGLVRSILHDGGLAVGVEGSDFSRVHGRAEWPIIPDNLFTADITRPFELHRDGAPLAFDVITAWDVLEHIEEAGLAGVLANVRDDLEEGGFFTGSICQAPYLHDGVALHRTVRPRAWWRDRFERAGWRARPDLEAHFGDEWLRGPHSDQPVTRSFLFAVSLP
jgi:2-polyprenyl-3-methyl-5-hydroxy-6-metoxy-1,4-benzoquinol methylase